MDEYSLVDDTSVSIPMTGPCHTLCLHGYVATPYAHSPQARVSPSHFIVTLHYSFITLRP